MMSLRKYEGKKVVLESIENKIYRGTIGDYIYPESNENGKESIVIDAVGYKYPIEFNEEEIKTIEVIK